MEKKIRNKEELSKAIAAMLIIGVTMIPTMAFILGISWRIFKWAANWGE